MSNERNNQTEIVVLKSILKEQLCHYSSNLILSCLPSDLIIVGSGIFSGFFCGCVFGFGFMFFFNLS